MTTLKNKSIQIITPENLDPNLEIGGKATNLFRLKNLGFQVPNWIVLPYDTLAASRILRDTFAEKEDFSNLAKEVNFRFEKGIRYAVRSSANVEDHGNHSFAGQFDSLLFVEKTDLAKAIKTVFESAQSAHVKTYCKHHDLAFSTIKMSVIVQEMVDAEVSGVGFGIHPVTGNSEQKIINAVYGIGEGLVSGELNSDLFEIEKNGAIKSTIANKKEQLVLDFEKGNLVKKSTPKSLRNIACLSENHLKEISKSLQKLEAKLGCPQDVEFAVFENEIYYLQTRPVTKTGTSDLTASQDLSASKIHRNTQEKHRQISETLTGLEAKNNRIVWDNSNIVESYPGITSPMTFSFIRRVYEAVYCEFALLMGVSAKAIETNRDAYKNMLGLINGRVYYNLAGWYRTLAMLPGYSINARFMETMMGVKERFDLTKDQLPSGKNYAGVFRMIFKTLKSLITLPRERDKFLKLLDRTIKNLEVIDLSKCTAEELVEHYGGMEKTLLKNWKAPLVNDFFAMIFYGLLQKLTNKWKVGNRQNFHNELLAGSNDIVSVEPIQMIENIYEKLQSEHGAKAFFAKAAPIEIWASLQSKKFPKTMLEINRYLQKFGDRSTGELKLETVTYRQAPEQFIQFLKNGLKNGFTPRKENKTEAIRTEAEAALNASLKGQPVRKFIFKKILKNARAMVSNRENMRFERTRSFGQVRRIFSALGMLWSKENLIKNDRDIFYLTLDEIKDFISGKAVSANLRAIVKMRKTEFESYENEPQTAERIETFGPVYQSNNFFEKPNFDESEEDNLQGIGCSPGVIRARVQVVKNPQEVGSLNGDILVTSCTDPSWVTLFPSTAAILVERGSMLSHSAIVAREMGIPCVVGISGLLQKLKTGDLIEMDGSSGLVRIL